MKRYVFSDSKMRVDDVREAKGNDEWLESHDSLIDAALCQHGPVLYEVKPGVLRNVNPLCEGCYSKSLKYVNRYDKPDVVFYHLAAKIAADVAMAWASPQELIAEYLKTGWDDTREQILEIAKAEELKITGLSSDDEEVVKSARLISDAVYAMISALSRGYVDKDLDYTPANVLKKTVQHADQVWFSRGQRTMDMEKIKYNEWLEEAFIQAV